MGAKNLLFVEPLADNDGPLFESQRDLAAALIAVKGGGFEAKQPDTLRIFVGQVLKRANEPNSRPLSRNLRRSLPQAIASRISDPERAQGVADAIIREIERMKSPSLVTSPLSDVQEWQAFLNATLNPRFRHIVITTCEPAETQPDSIRANELTDALIDRIFDSGDESDASNSIYDFFLPTAAIAGGMRIALVDRVANMLGKEMPEAAKLVDEAQESGRLNLYHIEGCHYFANTCVFDPALPSTQGYHLYYHENNQVSVAVLNRRAIENWFGCFFQPIYLTGDSYVVKPFGKTRPIEARTELGYRAAA